ncbi:MAG: hypothetical protein ACPLVI_08315 [Thermoplasmata archaeon]|nr:MAG: hypothetical protein C0180_07100 [Aciduliprofundum sp.]PMP73572.1 MAG: hypothetical protein C0180_06415 [Aciduliprofundum sp.]
MKGKDALAYVLYNLGCIHPFILSRIVALAELSYLKENKRRLTDLKYTGMQAAFYIENLNEIIAGDDCFRKREGDPSKRILGCIEYVCEPGNLDEDKKYLDEAMERAYDLTDSELNELVVKDEYYRYLIS